MISHRHRTRGRMVQRTIAIAALAALVAPLRAGAQAGDGICQPSEAQSARCATLGSNVLEVIPSNQAAQRGSRCPFTRISYRWLVASPVLMPWTVRTDLVSAHHIIW